MGKTECVRSALRRPANVIALLSLLALAACGTSQIGTVTGTAAPCIGPAISAHYVQQIPTRITLRRGQVVVASEVIHGRSTYSLTAPPGKYLLESDQETGAVHVSLRAGETIVVNLIPVCK